MTIWPESHFGPIPLTDRVASPDINVSDRKSTMLRCVSLVIALLLVSGAASAQKPLGPHSTSDEDACDRDAHRLCREAIPDQFRVLTCLQANRAKLGKACAAVLQSHGM
jgi:hypothetical protein